MQEVRRCNLHVGILLCFLIKSFIVVCYAKNWCIEFYICMSFKDFFNQIIEGTNENRHRPLVKVWVGPIPFLVLFHAETIEVCIIKALITVPALLATKCDESYSYGHSM